MYKVGDILNIGYYAGYKSSVLIKTEAEVYDIKYDLIYIKIPLPYGGYRKMFGYDGDLKQLEKNYYNGN